MRNIAVFKNTNKEAGSNQPDYRLVASWQDDAGAWQSVTVASLWAGDKDGNGPVLKGQMKDEYTNAEGKTFPAFKIARDDKQPAPQEKTPAQQQVDDIRSQEPDIEVPF